MNTTRFITVTLRTTTLGLFLAGSATVAAAQKATHTAGPPMTTHGTVRANAKADKGQDVAESKRADARDDKAARAADKGEDKAEATALKAARSEPKAVLKGIKLTAAERTAIEAIEKKDADQIKELRKQEDAAEKSGKPDATFAAKIDAVRTQERADLRAALTPAQQAAFDKNVAALGAKKP